MDESVVRGAIESWTDTGDLASKLCETVKERRERERERERRTNKRFLLVSSREIYSCLETASQGATSHYNSFVFILARWLKYSALQLLEIFQHDKERKSTTDPAGFAHRALPSSFLVPAQ